MQWLVALHFADQLEKATSAINSNKQHYTLSAPIWKDATKGKRWTDIPNELWGFL